MTPAFSPPYYTVVFVSRLSGHDPEGYAHTAEEMEALARKQPGFLGMDSVRQGDNGITVSYWRDEESIANWRAVTAHRAAQRKGRDTWYDAYVVHVARVERSYACGGGLENASR